MAVEKCVFTWRIEKFSLRTIEGSCIKSHVFHTNGCKWRFTATVSTECKESVSVYLVKSESSESHFVIVKISIVGPLATKWESAKEEVLFNPVAHAHKILSVSKDYLMKGFCSLNKFRFIPGDSLTLLCDVSAYSECPAAIYTSRDDFEHSFARFHSDLKEVEITALHRFVYCCKESLKKVLHYTKLLFKCLLSLIFFSFVQLMILTTVIIVGGYL